MAPLRYCYTYRKNPFARHPPAKQINNCIYPKWAKYKLSYVHFFIALKRPFEHLVTFAPPKTNKNAINRWCAENSIWSHTLAIKSGLMYADGFSIFPRKYVTTYQLNTSPSRALSSLINKRSPLALLALTASEQIIRLNAYSGASRVFYSTSLCAVPILSLLFFLLSDLWPRQVLSCEQKQPKQIQQIPHQARTTDPSNDPRFRRTSPILCSG